jgi:hypothetical protein
MKKISILSAAFLLLITGLYADDSFFSGGFGDEAFGDESSTSAVEINGSLSASVRAYVSPDAVDAMADLDDEADSVEAATEIGLTFNYEGTDFKVISDFVFTPSLEDGDIDSMVSVNEAYGQYFADKLNFQAGYMKVVWGKADEAHVVDVLNNTNYSDGLVTDYLEMIDPELMFKVNIPLGMSSMLELAYVPTLTVDYFETSGDWAPVEVDELDDTIDYLEYYYGAFTALDTDTNTLDYGQAAAHFTSTIGGFDYGFTYYAGYNKMPSFNYSITDNTYWYEYDPMHTFGVEAAYILAGFNFKGEFAYNMTYDFDGDETDVHNHNIKWVGGFDRDIPVSNLNINIQEMGSYILNNDEFTSSDIEYDEDDVYTQNVLIVAISDKYLHDKLEVELIGFYHFEDSDYGIYPTVEYTPVDDLTFAMEARFFGGDDDTLFGQYDDNDFVEFSVIWNF